MDILLLLRLFAEYFKIGLFSVGGGLATMPFLYQLAEKTSWFTAEELTNMIAISESTPGPIGINMATYVGWKMAGIPGVLCTTIGLVAPSFIVILLIASLLRTYKDDPLVKSAFYGLRPASLALISVAGIAAARVTFLKTGLWQAAGAITDLFNYKALIFGVVLFFLTRKFKKSLLPFLALSAVVGIVFKFAA